MQLAWRLEQKACGDCGSPNFCRKNTTSWSICLSRKWEIEGVDIQTKITLISQVSLASDVQSANSREYRMSTMIFIFTTKYFGAVGQCRIHWKSNRVGKRHKKAIWAAEPPATNTSSRQSKGIHALLDLTLHRESMLWRGVVCVTFCMTFAIPDPGGEHCTTAQNWRLKCQIKTNGDLVSTSDRWAGKIPYSGGQDPIAEHRRRAKSSDKASGNAQSWSTENGSHR